MDKHTMKLYGISFFVNLIKNAGKTRAEMFCIFAGMASKHFSKLYNFL